jgi:hypothetical protein
VLKCGVGDAPAGTAGQPAIRRTRHSRYISVPFVNYRFFARTGVSIPSKLPVLFLVKPDSSEDDAFIECDVGGHCPTAAYGAGLGRTEWVGVEN